jgi:hypothetical protein
MCDIGEVCGFGALPEAGDVVLVLRYNPADRSAVVRFLGFIYTYNRQFLLDHFLPSQIQRRPSTNEFML